LRLPTRIRGVAAGLAILTLSPIVVAGARHVGVGTAHRTAPASVRNISAQVPGLVTATVVPTSIPAPPPPPPPPPPAPPPKPARVAAPVDTSVPNYPAGSIQQIIIDAANAHGVSASWMLKIARCESGFNPRAYNPAGPYIGLFQFLPSTFRAHGGTDIYDPVQQSNITATMLANGQSHAWGCA